MKIAPSTRVLNDSEIDRLHKAMLRILGKVGVRIENEKILSRLADYGGCKIDIPSMMVFFADEYVERFIAESERIDWDKIEPRVKSGAGIFEGFYLDPETDDFVPWTERRIIDYAKLAYYLPT